MRIDPANLLVRWTTTKQWPFVVLIATVQLGAFMFAVVTMVNWTTEQQQHSLPAWWNLLVLFISVIGVAGIGPDVVNVDASRQRQ